MSFIKKKTSGIFIPGGSGFVNLTGVPDRSINGIIEFLGFNHQQIYTYHSSVTKSNILAICFKIFTRDIVCVIASDITTYISPRILKQFLVNFSVAKVYDSILIKDILDEGIVFENLTISYLSETLNLRNTSSNGVFFSEKIKTYLYFTDGILTNYQFDDGLFPWAKNLKQHNKITYDKIAKVASKYRQDDPFLANKEINVQAEAWANIPHAAGNEFVRLHTHEGAINFHMLRVCHYSTPIEKHEFEELNYGRFQEISRSDTSITYQLGGFQYHFANDGNLVSILRGEDDFSNKYFNVSP
jgi:hypothetical protein